MRYFLVEVYNAAPEYIGTWCSLAETEEDAIKDMWANTDCDQSPHTVKVRYLRQHNWSSEIPRAAIGDGLLREAEVKLLETHDPHPTNLLKRIREYLS